MAGAAPKGDEEAPGAAPNAEGAGAPKAPPVVDPNALVDAGAPKSDEDGAAAAAGAPKAPPPPPKAEVAVEPKAPPGAAPNAEGAEEAAGAAPKGDAAGLEPKAPPPNAEVAGCVFCFVCLWEAGREGSRG